MSAMAIILNNVDIASRKPPNLEMCLQSRAPQALTVTGLAAAVMAMDLSTTNLVEP